MTKSFQQVPLPKIFQQLTTLYFVYLLIATVHGQTILNPEITSSKNQPFEEAEDVTLLCTLTRSETPNFGQQVLAWSREDNFPLSNQITTNEENNNGFVTYESRLTFKPVARDNKARFKCAATIGTLTGDATYEVDVILKPDPPVVTGPTTLRSSETGTWLCESTGSSYTQPNVYFRNGNGLHMFSAKQDSSFNIDQYSNRIATIELNLTTSLPNDSPTYTLICYVLHEYPDSGYYKMEQTSFGITVYFPPVVTKSESNTVYVTAGTRKTISCIISSTSPAAMSVVWKKDGTIVSINNGRYEGGSVGFPSLVIKSVSLADEGDYMCTVSNVEGEGSFTTPTTLIVRYIWAPA